MDYSQLSDFEINKRVAQLHGGFALTLAVHDETPSGKSFDPGRFDPCNNPADAWPIISGHKLSIINADDEWLCVPEDTAVDGITGDDVQMIYSGDGHIHANPLRAAMIVFLMMQDATHA